MPLSAEARTRYARHLHLPQLGEAGQARLVSTRLKPSLDADAGAREVALCYLTRAGLGLSDAG